MIFDVLRYDSSNRNLLASRDMIIIRKTRGQIYILLFLQGVLFQQRGVKKKERKKNGYSADKMSYLTLQTH